MTRTGVFMRLSVLVTASFHWSAFMRSTRPVKREATKTPVPAAEIQLMVKRAASGLAVAAATGGMRCTMLWSAGMSQAGSESVPAKGEPRSVVLMGTPAKSSLKAFLMGGHPQMAQHMIKIAQGNHA